MMQKQTELITSFEEVRLYLMILDTQGKFKESLEILEGPLGKLCKLDEERERMILGYMDKLQMPTTNKCKQILRNKYHPLI